MVSSLGNSFLISFNLCGDILHKRSFFPSGPGRKDSLKKMEKNGTAKYE